MSSWAAKACSWSMKWPIHSWAGETSGRFLLGPVSTLMVKQVTRSYLGSRACSWSVTWSPGHPVGALLLGLHVRGQFKRAFLLGLHKHAPGRFLLGLHEHAHGQVSGSASMLMVK